LVGRWRSLATSRGGIGSTLVFRKGGVVEYSLGAVVEMPYRVEGTQLIFPADTKAGPELRQTITWLPKNRVRLTTAGEPGTELTRSDSRPVGADTIVGEWRSVREVGGHQLEVLYLFYPTGRSLLLMPFRTEQGRYSSGSSRVHLEWPDCPMPDAAFSIEGDILTFMPIDSRQSRYARY
jgi:hypothetical protein